MANPDISHISHKAPILIIDDDDRRTRDLIAALDGAAPGGSGLEIVTAASGEDGLRHLVRRPFAAVLLDARIPGQGGIETARQIRRRRDSQATPILFIGTSAPSEADLAEGCALGVVDYLMAPILPQILRAKVGLFAELFGKTRLIERQAEESERTVSDRTRAMRDTEEKFRLIIDNVQEYAILVLDAEGRFSSWNAGAQRLLGYSEEEVIGTSGFRIFTPEDIQAGDAAREIETAKETGQAVDERWHVRRDGTRFWGSGMMTAMRDERGNLRGFVKIMRDFTERREARDREEAERKKAEEANRRQLWHLGAMNEISRVLEANLDLESILQAAMEKLLAVFACDRAYLAQPGHPGEGQVSLPFIATRPEHPGPPNGTALPMDAFNTHVFREILGTAEPMAYGEKRPVPGYDFYRDHFSIRSLLVIALKAPLGATWVLGIQDCTEARDWSDEERSLFKEVAFRISGTLYNLLFHRRLRDSEERFRQLADRLPQIVWTATPDGTLDYLNDRWFEYSGESADGKAVHTLRDHVHPDDFGKARETWRHRIGSGEAYEEEFRLRNAQGEYRWHLSLALPIRDASDRIWKWVGSLTDVEAQKRTEAELRKSRAQRDTILEVITDSIIVQDPSGRIEYMNQAAAEFLGFRSPEAVLEIHGTPEGERFRQGMAIYDEEGKPYPPDMTPGAMALRGLESPPKLLRYRMKPESPEKWVHTRSRLLRDEKGAVQFIMTILQDVTEFRKAETELRQSQKMDAIGRLAGGIAHDFNNLLTAINGYSELGLGMAAGGDPLKPVFKEILDAGRRAAGLTNQLLAHSRKQIMAPKVIDLNDTIGAMHSMLTRIIGEDIELVTTLHKDVRLVRADPGQIEQVILNLAVNARDAMPKGGKVTIETRVVSVGRGHYGVVEEIPEGDYFLIAFSDNGEGMTTSIKDHIFEPFFTTKSSGKGTGLGLSTVYGIVKQSGGYITVYSEPRFGSTFKLFFPLVAGSRADPDGQPADEGSAGGPANGETILLAEDEDVVRRLGKAVLDGLNYRVLEAGNGEDALRVAEAFPERIDLLLTDVVMHGIGGRDLATRIREIRPDIKVIYMSGYTDDAIVRHGILEATADFLQKPFSPKALARKIREVLSPQPVSPSEPFKTGG
ncbi:MAG: multi-sensor hybrid histidine kinase [Fibrobacteres bacterium]|nr:multi-sensor hybrid histidine kinase [Fibrobacterota bacterium]